jgi:RNA polymerase sigma factor (TIGR02999 family)
VADHPGRAAADLVEEAYLELRRIADGYVHRERVPSIQATELVHEAYLRLAREAAPIWKDRTHFLAIAAISMRRLLVERARARHASKRGSHQVRVTLDEGLLRDPGPEDEAGLDLVALDGALTRLASLDPAQTRIVELRYFGGLTVEETAASLAISPATQTPLDRRPRVAAA